MQGWAPWEAPTHHPPPHPSPLAAQPLQGKQEQSDPDCCSCMLWFLLLVVGVKLRGHK